MYTTIHLPSHTHTYNTQTCCFGTFKECVNLWKIEYSTAHVSHMRSHMRTIHKLVVVLSKNVSDYGKCEYSTAHISHMHSHIRIIHKLVVLKQQ